MWEVKIYDTKFILIEKFDLQTFDFRGGKFPTSLTLVKLNYDPIVKFSYVTVEQATGQHFFIFHGIDDRDKIYKNIYIIEKSKVEEE